MSTNKPNPKKVTAPVAKDVKKPVAEPKKTDVKAAPKSAASWDTMFAAPKAPEPKKEKKVDSSQQYMDDAIVSIQKAPQSEFYSNKPMQKGPSHSSGGPRQLEKAASWVDTNTEGTKVGTTLNDLEHQDKGPKYDQFKGKTTGYKESIYNSTYDIKKFSKQQIDHAHKMEREINQAPSHGNLHLAQERGQAQLTDNMNEEKMYSQVERSKPKRQPVNQKKFTCFNKQKNFPDLIKTPHTPRMPHYHTNYDKSSVFSNRWSNIMRDQVPYHEQHSGRGGYREGGYQGTQNKFGHQMQNQAQSQWQARPRGDSNNYNPPQHNSTPSFVPQQNKYQNSQPQFGFQGGMNQGQNQYGQQQQPPVNQMQQMVAPPQNQMGMNVSTGTFKPTAQPSQAPSFQPTSSYQSFTPKPAMPAPTAPPVMPEQVKSPPQLNPSVAVFKPGPPPKMNLDSGSFIPGASTQQSAPAYNPVQKEFTPKKENPLPMNTMSTPFTPGGAGFNK